MSRLIAFILLVCTTMTQSAKLNAKVVVCGDSRIVGVASEDGVSVKDKVAIGYNTDKTIYYLAEVGEGYNWLVDELPKLKKICDKNTVVYIALGVNDLYNLEDYIKLYKTLSKKLGGAKIVIAEVGGVDESKESDYGYSIKQYDIDNFNSKLRKSASSYTVIDFWYGDESTKTTDGIHYSKKEYKNTLNALKEDLDVQ